MGQQSLLKYNSENLLSEARKNILEQADRVILREDFLLGKEWCAESYEHNSMINWVLTDANCDIKEKTDSILRGDKVKKVGIFTPDTIYTSETDLYKLWLSKGNTGTLSEFLELVLKDEELKLEQENW